MSNHINKFSRRFFISMTTAALVVACNQTQGEQQTQDTGGKIGGQVNIYSARHYNTDDELYEGFTEQTGIKVNLIEGKDDELIERIKSEGTNSPADILITVDGGRLWRADQAGIFAPVKSAILTEKIPEHLHHPGNLWFGYSKRARVIMYNKDKVNPTDISSYEDLADPKWKGKILVRSSSNIYNQSLVAGMIEEKGEEATAEWIKGLIANLARPPQSNDTGNIEAVAAGLGDVTIANTYYLARYEDNPEVFSKIGVIFPNQSDRGTHVNISGAGMLANAPHQEQAIAFLEYLATPKAQEFFALGNNEYPVVEGTPSNSVLQSFGEFKEDTNNVSAYGKNNADAVKIMDRSGWK
ncbi:Fe(3+) ABC transporter substrate-binding protein [Waterburya agarophytonicola K14]|uniref:Fe(3+) ABC transporter substrate-binding protein n=1 Tax=Waterburya agarophytonicola KI4 TaxID=2874699 RepID=A0A964FFW6_9CYAN|nr:Fe(3+) ABC transporter substrate-binding protein [Waterburya agarophytonicola]MCC0178300.1 Fe(3+) ABC transporter substrate-binding protein [Waterburya agarophytonicola KI4]